MRCNPLSFGPIAVCVLLVSGAAAAADGGALPDGAGAFRRQMTAWSPPEPAPAPADAAQLAPPPQTGPTVRLQRLPRLSSRFGLRADPLGGGERMHSGIDIPGPLGSPILAADSGVVTFAGRDGGYGLMIELDHENGLRTRYGHLSRILVSVGARVPREAQIGLMGSTGRSTGSHLHFEVLQNGMRVDPLAFLGRGQAARPFVAHRTVPFIGETAPVHISRFAQANALYARTGDMHGCVRQDDQECQGEGP